MRRPQARAVDVGELEGLPPDKSPAQQPSVLVLVVFKCYRHGMFLATLAKDATMDTVLIPGGLTPLVQLLDRMLNKKMKRRLRTK